jgi:hypothetical protein
LQEASNLRPRAPFTKLQGPWTVVQVTDSTDHGSWTFDH